ncbi:WxL domain-containing protein [Listeria cornellensis]|uniref:WxL domain-containing protein n=1 Tax=Listeria cornellensis FSL F6-0969 TaxID=1265820 RepID=W7BQ89_9LIST|nr:WxL domain-containing protein [Listeria cornellensis]EUJ25301.1 hypothetical protein PCORN_18149 [Listeria cornellensis FSL F6-0969]
MNFKKLVVITTITAGALSAFTATASAAESTGTSQAGINFTEGVGPTFPVDPSDPTKPLDPNDPLNPTDPETGNTGSLTLDYVSSMDFGEQEISSSIETYSSTSIRPFIQVTDRRGSGTGWAVTAKASEFKDEEGKASLKGAEIALKNAEISSASHTAAKPSSEQLIELSMDGVTEAKVVSAGVDEGMGTWVNRWFGDTPEEAGSLNDNVQLTIPAGSATVGAHEAKVTWTLTDAPEA